MRTLRRYLAAESWSPRPSWCSRWSCLFRSSTVEEIKDLGRGGYQLKHAALHVLLRAPTHVYEVFPIAALIGDALFALTQLVASSEYTVIRTSGVSLLRFNGALVAIGSSLPSSRLSSASSSGRPQSSSRSACARLRSPESWRRNSAPGSGEGRPEFCERGEVTPAVGAENIRIYEFDAEIGSAP